MSRVIRRVTLLPHHVPTGAVRHSVFSGLIEDEDGVRLDRSNPRLPPPVSLAIVTFSDSEFNLIHLDGNGSEITDTFHESLDDALAQGLREFTIQPGDWDVVSEPY
jgi:hypothetical protein